MKEEEPESRLVYTSDANAERQNRGPSIKSTQPHRLHLSDLSAAWLQPVMAILAVTKAGQTSRRPTPASGGVCPVVPGCIQHELAQLYNIDGRRISFP